MSKSSSESSLFDEKQQLSLDDDSFNDSQPINQSTNQSINQFDEFIGLIEEIIVTDDFEEIQTKFINQHYQSFNQGLDSENRLTDSDLHFEYQSIIENFLIEKLKENDPDFTLEALQEAIHAYLQAQEQANQSIDQSINESGDSVDESGDSINQSICQSINPPTELHEFLASLDDFMAFKSLMCDAYEASKRSNDDGFGLTITPLQVNKN